MAIQTINALVGGVLRVVTTSADGRHGYYISSTGSRRSCWIGDDGEWVGEQCISIVPDYTPGAESRVIYY